MSRYRIPGKGRVDHSAPVFFTFDGKTYGGLRGDTVASALLANGVHLAGRSFKYHRPRGIMTAGPEEPVVLAGRPLLVVRVTCAVCGGHRPIYFEPAP